MDGEERSGMMAAAFLVAFLFVRVRVSTFGCLMARGHAEQNRRAEEKPAFAFCLSECPTVKQAGEACK